MKLNKEDLPPTDGEWEYENWSSCWISKLSGRFHNSLGPAVERSDGRKEWYVNGKRHRLDGPAIECTDGIKGWWVNGKHVNEEEFSSAVISFLFSIDKKSVQIIVDAL